MGVYIPNVEMPDNCALCPMWDAGNCLAASEAIICEYNKRPSDCPLLSVPPHGRLIDADKLEKSFREDADAEWNRFAAPVNWADAFDDVANIVADAPTVIEAEEDE